MGGSCNIGTGAWHRSRHGGPSPEMGMAMDDSPNIPGSPGTLISWGQTQETEARASTQQIRSTGTWALGFP